MMTPEKLLSYELDLFKDLRPDDFSGADVLVREVSFETWQTVFDQKDTSNDLYVLISGHIVAMFLSAEGKEIIFSRFPNGGYFGELAALDGAPRSLAVVAKSESRVLVVKREFFLWMYNNIPTFHNRIVQGLINSVRALTDRQMEIATLTVEERVAGFLFRFAAERNALRQTLLTDVPTHAEIAASVGANREMVSRAVSKLNKRGLIQSSRQQLTILDADALSAYVI